MKGIICIDFTRVSYDQLKDFSEEYNFVYEILQELKQKTYAKMWFLLDGTGVAFTLTRDNIFKIKDYEKVRMFDGFVKDLKDIKLYVPKPKEIILDVDVILDKILKYGEKSLSKEEKDFLDNINK
jgi:hypothetical protein